MQFGSAFQRLLRKILQAEPKWGPLFLMKGYISDYFYQDWLQAQGLSQLVLVMKLYIRYGEPLISFPLLALMVWV